MSGPGNSLKEDARFRTLRLIEARPQITQRELASELGISLGSTHYTLRALAEAGLIRLARFSQSDNKRGYAYVLTPSGLAEKARVTARFLERKRAEYEALRAEIEELSAELDKHEDAPRDEQAQDSGARH